MTWMTRYATSGYYAGQPTIKFHLGTDGLTLCGRTVTGRWLRRMEKTVAVPISRLNCDCYRCQDIAIKRGLVK